MTDVLIRNVPPPVLDKLKKRASRNMRSLQQELLTILEDAAGADELKAAEAANMVRERLAAYNRDFSDSTKSIREDRDR